jgi:putative ABC transport system ATP-binding protein
MKKLITADKIIKKFGQGSEKQTVLCGVSMEIGEGEFVAVMGPSGSGKSTLLFALSGMDTIDSGTVTFEGMNLWELREKKLADLRRTKMGFVFQQPTLLKNLNILDNIIFPSMRDNRNHVVQITQKAKMLMQKTGISELAERNITEVSGGQLQRAGICRALMSDPKIIFADEPTGALNSKASQEIMDIFTQINAQGTALLLVTHDVRVASRAKRVLFMRDGCIVSELRFANSGGNMEDNLREITEKMKRLGI